MSHEIKSWNIFCLKLKQSEDTVQCTSVIHQFTWTSKISGDPPPPPNLLYALTSAFQQLSALPHIHLYFFVTLNSTVCLCVHSNLSKHSHRVQGPLSLVCVVWALNSASIHTLAHTHTQTSEFDCRLSSLVEFNSQIYRVTLTCSILWLPYQHGCIAVYSFRFIEM